MAGECRCKLMLCIMGRQERSGEEYLTVLQAQGHAGQRFALTVAGIAIAVVPAKARQMHVTFDREVRVDDQLRVALGERHTEVRTTIVVSIAAVAATQE